MNELLKELAKLRSDKEYAHKMRMDMLEDVKQSEGYKELDDWEKEYSERIAEVESKLKEKAVTEFEKTGKKKLNDFVTVTVSHAFELTDKEEAEVFAQKKPAFMVVDWKELGKYAKTHELDFYEAVEKVGLRIKRDLSGLLE